MSIVISSDSESDSDFERDLVEIKRRSMMDNNIKGNAERVSLFRMFRLSTRLL